MADEILSPPTRICDGEGTGERAGESAGESGDAWRELPLAWRVLGLVAVVAGLALIAALVMARDVQRQSADRSAGATVSTAAVLPRRGSGLPIAGPGDSRPRPGTTLPLTTDDIATALEKEAQRETGWTHKLACSALGAIGPGATVECLAVTEPPIDGVAPSRFVAVVLDDGARFVWLRGSPGAVSIEVLRSMGAPGCGQMLADGIPYGVAYASWVVRGRPAALDAGGGGRPCEGTYPTSDIDAFFALALPRAWMRS